jgi:tryptophan synthase beta chain
MKLNSYIKNRHFGKFGGRYVPEMLIPALDELEETYEVLKNDEQFNKELDDLQVNYIGRPSPLYYAENLTKKLGGCKIFLKLESLNHTGAHKINNCVGQILIAKKLGKKTIIAETGAGQHGLATATVAAKFGMKCKIFMGEVDIKRQYPNVYSMKLLGAEVVPVKYGSRTLKDAVNEAFKYWVENLEDTYYLLGSALGPYPYPVIVRDFQSVVGREVRDQIKAYGVSKPDILVACVGGGSNSMGLFYPFLEDDSVSIYGVEAGGRSNDKGENAIRFGANSALGIVQGYKSYFIQDEDGQLLPTHSISAGLDYAGVGPELAYLHDSGRVIFESASDAEVLNAVKTLSRLEGIIPALESSHAIAYAIKHAPSIDINKSMVVNVSGRGDKDLFITARELDRENWISFLKEEYERD